ncbi:M48 family metalloprotease [Kribbella shirazensis]|uniref:Zn-dependent protease with chaperone function n=1 Tax=Kribbella shirazensis TaxID=1105143 RepID=A0A7X5VGK0_9ACTN|nr:M48 family metalloprotease [Kribbella shirazensis]NIK60823.1 Zn-dependent protease with chaperone function [Kribbella shirazensis]
MNASDGNDERPGSFSADSWQPAPRGPGGGGAPEAPNSTPGSFSPVDGPAQSAPPPQQGVRISVPSAAELLLGIPWALWSFGVVSSVAAWFSPDWVSLSIVVLWVLSGLVVIVPATEDFIAKYLYRLRRPTLMEQQKLDISWRTVCTRAGVDPGYYRLWVEESDTINGAAVAGHSVAITRWALNNLPPRQLQAVLAHELGHHRGGHPWATLLVFWYAQPGRLMVSFIQALFRLGGRVPALGCVIVGFFALSLAGLILNSMIFGNWDWAGYALLPFLVPIPLAWFSRRAELMADRVAGELGYARDTIAFLYDLQSQGQDVARRAAGWRGALYATHPTLADRIRTLERYTQGTRS